MRLTRAVIAVVSAVTALAGFVLPVGQAAAGGQEITICWVVGEVGGRPVFDCVTVVVPELAPDLPLPPGCPECAPAWRFGDALDPALVPKYIDVLGDGIRLLGEAAQAQDEGQAEQLRLAATQSFLASAEILGTSEIDLDEVGWADLKNQTFLGDPTPQPNLEAAGVGMVEGLRLMRKALGEPDPQPMIDAAMAGFDAAYSALAEFAAG